MRLGEHLSINHTQHLGLTRPQCFLVCFAEQCWPTCAVCTLVFPVSLHSNLQERLGNLTNKCMDGGAADLEYFVQESAHILGLQEQAQDAKVIRVPAVLLCTPLQHADFIPELS